MEARACDVSVSGQRSEDRRQRRMKDAPKGELCHQCTASLGLISQVCRQAIQDNDASGELHTSRHVMLEMLRARTVGGKISRGAAAQGCRDDEQ